MVVMNPVNIVDDTASTANCRRLLYWIWLISSELLDNRLIQLPYETNSWLIIIQGLVIGLNNKGRVNILTGSEMRASKLGRY